MDVVLQYGLAGIVSYGFVGILTYLLQKRAIILDSHVKLGLLILVAFLVSFVPPDLGSYLLNHIKDAIAIGLSLSTVNTLANKMGGA